MGAAPSRSGVVATATAAEVASSSSSSPSRTAAPPPAPSPLSALAPPNPALPYPTHLVVLVHGIVGSPANWAYITAALRSRPGADGAGFAVLPSAANSIKWAGPRGTFEGVDVCGARVAAEVRAAVAEVQAARAAAGAPPLDRVSVLSHSMGGLIARFAVSHLYDPGGGGSEDDGAGRPARPTIAGLRPVAFATIATPHAGCTGATASAAAIPLVRWLRPPAALAAALDGPVAATMGRTGRQFFLRDGGGGGGGSGRRMQGGVAGGDDAAATTTAPPHPPLLVRMAQATPGDLPFLPALAAFAYRAAYANSSGDHLVGWANASLRYTDELPDLGGLPGGTGVILDTGLASGLGGADPLTPHRSGGAAAAAAPAGPAASRAEREEVVAILEGLRSLPWRRVDVCYKGAWHRGAAAHNLIQVTRAWCRWLDPEAGAAEAVCEALVAVDAEVLRAAGR